MILYFVDCETTGLSPQRNTILEFCAIKHVNRVEVDRLYLKIAPTDLDIATASTVALELNGFDPEKWKTQHHQSKPPTRSRGSYMEPVKRPWLVTM